jgi:hypothetical protein
MDDMQNCNQGQPEPVTTERGGTHRLAGALFVLLAVGSAGCMFDIDGKVVEATSEEIPFWGVSTADNDPVQVQAFDGSSWTTIANATSSIPYTANDGTELFYWGIDVAVPANRWRPGTTGFVAQVRALVGTGLYQANTFTEDWISCYEDSVDTIDFVNNCKSPRSPNAFIYTTNYPGGVDVAVSGIRRATAGAWTCRSATAVARARSWISIATGAAHRPCTTSTRPSILSRLKSFTSLSLSTVASLSPAVFGG